MFIRRIALSCVLLAPTSICSAVDIAGQDFDALAALDDDGLSTNFTDATLDSSLGEQPLDTTTSPFHTGATNTRTDAGLQFFTTWFGSRPNDGTDADTPDLGNDGIGDGPKTTTTGQFAENSDFIGVSGFGGFSSPDVDPFGNIVMADFADSNGVHSYNFNDGDGTIRLTFEAVDISAFTGVGFSFYHWIAPTGFESDERGTDTFLVRLVDENMNEQVLIDFGPDELNAAQVAADEGNADEWTLFSAPITLPGDMITAIFESDQNSSAENIFIDNVLFSDGFEIPVLVGDYNGDEVVDAADYTLWRDNLGDEDGDALMNRAPELEGTAVTVADYENWKDAFGEGSGAIGAVASPEPASAAMLALAAALVGRTRRRQ